MRPAALCTAVLFSLALAGCGTLPRYTPGSVSAERYAADQRICESLAHQAADAYEDTADRYDDASAAQQIGAVLGAGIAQNIAKKRTFKQCMESAGYAPATRRQAGNRRQ